MFNLNIENMAQLQLSFDEVPATPQSSTSVSSFDVDEKVTHRFNITANVLEFLVSQGLFVQDDFEWETAADVWARQHDEVEDGPSWYEVSCAYERLQEAMEQADADASRVQTAEMYVENVYYYYGINSVSKQESPLPYSDFMRACNGFATRYNQIF